MQSDLSCCLSVCLSVCRFSREQSEGQFERPCLLQPPRRGCQGQGVPSGPDRPAVAQRRPEPGGQPKQGAQELELRGARPRAAGLPRQGRRFPAELGRWVGQPSSWGLLSWSSMRWGHMGLSSCVGLCSPSSVFARPTRGAGAGASLLLRLTLPEYSVWTYPTLPFCLCTGVPSYTLVVVAP